MDIGSGCTISTGARLDRTNPRGLHVGCDTRIAFGATILTHNFIHRLHVHTYIGNRCRIGPHAVIMAGIKVGDDCIIGAGAVIMRDVAAGSKVIGNPGRVQKTSTA